MPVLSVEQLANIQLCIEVRKAKAAQGDTAHTRDCYVDTAESEGTMSDYDTYISPLRTPHPGDNGIDDTKAQYLRKSPSDAESSIAALFNEREESVSSQDSGADIGVSSSFHYQRTDMPQSSALDPQQVQYTKGLSSTDDTKMLKRKMVSSPSPERKRQRLPTHNGTLVADSAGSVESDVFSISHSAMIKDAILKADFPISSSTSPSVSQIARELRMKPKSPIANYRQRRAHARPSPPKQPLPNAPLYDALYSDSGVSNDYDYTICGVGDVPSKAEGGEKAESEVADAVCSSQPTQTEDYQRGINQLCGEPSPDDLECEWFSNSCPPASLYPRSTEDWKAGKKPFRVKVYEAQRRQLEDYRLKKEGKRGNPDSGCQSFSPPIMASFYPQTDEGWDEINAPKAEKTLRAQKEQLENYQLKVKGDIGKYEVDWNSTVIPVWSQPAAYTAFHEWRKQQLCESPPSSISTDSKAIDIDGSETTASSGSSSSDEDTVQPPISATVFQTTSRIESIHDNVSSAALITKKRVPAQSSHEQTSAPSMSNVASLEQANPAVESYKIPQQLKSAQELRQSASEDAGDSLSPKKPEKTEPSMPNVASVEHANPAVEIPQQLPSAQDVHQRASEDTSDSVSHKETGIENSSTPETQTPSNSSKFTADSSSLHISPASSPPAATQNHMAPGEEGKIMASIDKKQKIPKPPRQGRKNKHQKKPLGPIPSKVEKPYTRMTRSKAKINHSTKFTSWTTLAGCQLTGTHEAVDFEHQGEYQQIVFVNYIRTRNPIHSE